MKSIAFDYVCKYDVDRTVEALSKIHKGGFPMSYLVPKSRGGDTHKGDYLRAAVIRFERAREPRYRIVINRLPF